MVVNIETAQKAIEKYVEQRGENRFTTADIARHMGVDEYPVRAAVSWLNRYRVIEAIPGVRSQRYTRLNGEAYSAAVYQIREHGSEPDFAVLNMVFCYGGCR